MTPSRRSLHERAHKIDRDAREDGVRAPAHAEKHSRSVAIAPCRSS